MAGLARNFVGALYAVFRAPCHGWLPVSLQSESMTETPNANHLVLLADDDPIFRSLVASRLARLSCRVVEAQDGAEAWSKARGQVFDFAIVDFEMPGLNGVGLVQCLRGHPRTKHLPIVMCTSRTDGGAMREAMEAGITSFLTKPLNWSVFDSHVGHLLHSCERFNESSRDVERLEQALADKDTATTKLIEELRRHLDGTQPTNAVAVAHALSAMRAAIEHFEAASRQAASIERARTRGMAVA